MLRHRKAGDRDSGMKYCERLEQEISSWPGASAHPHRFGGREFRFKAAEIGHIHIGGTVDIPFPRSIRDVLLAEGLAQEHRWVPNSGWITFQVRGEEGFRHAVWLMRLSYLRYALKTATDPRRCLDEYSEELQLSPQLISLLEPFLPRAAVA
jgi:luciferase-like monooxygenase